MKNIFLVVLNLAIFNIISKERSSSEPYVSGDTFRKFCNFIVDETDTPFEPSQVKNGNTIFVSTEPLSNLKKFFEEYHPKINAQYILITHNGDRNMPGEFFKYLDDEKIFVWLTQDMDLKYHKKMIPIPIGLENKHWNRNYSEIIDKLIGKRINLEPKRYLLYANFNISNNLRIRKPIEFFFKQKNFCFFETSRKNVYDYLVDVCHSKFILSPHGNGLDCHRTWEALYLETIPIVKTSTLDKLYDDLPVIIVDSWKSVTPEFLEKKYIEMQNKVHKKEKLYFNYWANLITEYQNKCRNVRQ